MFNELIWNSHSSNRYRCIRCDHVHIQLLHFRNPPARTASSTVIIGIPSCKKIIQHCSIKWFDKSCIDDFHVNPFCRKCFAASSAIGIVVPNVKIAASCPSRSTSHEPIGIGRNVSSIGTPNPFPLG